MRKPGTALLVVIAFVLAGCFEGDPEFAEEEQIPEDERAAENDVADDEEEPADGEAVTFVAADILFEEAPSEVPAGSVEFELVNEGSIMHNVTLDDTDEVVVEADGGETATGSVDLEPGEYDYHCSVPGHEDAMSGTFTVTE